VWLLGLSARVALLPLVPHFSDDIYRYMWDGWVQSRGISPFLYAPADPALAALRTSWHALINHPGVPTIYPPGAQVVFRLLTVLGSSVLTFKAAWLAADLGVAWLVDRIATRGRAARAAGTFPAASLPLLLYLWSPLLLIEVAWSGHLEPLGLAPMMAAVWLAGRRGAEPLRSTEGPGNAPGRRAALGAGILLGVGAAVKFAPAAALPALARRGERAAAAAGVVVLALLYAPYVSAGRRLFTGLATYADRWRFNPGPYRILEAATGHTYAAKALAAGAVAALLVEAARRRWSVERTLLWTIGAALFLTPTLHPWYALWILPLAAVARSRGWILFTGLTFLGYWGLDSYAAGAGWPQPAWISAFIYGAPAALLLFDAWADRHAGRPARGRRGTEAHRGPHPRRIAGSAPEA